jgi:3-hydroxybutyryl-CoA dehydratase
LAPGAIYAGQKIRFLRPVLVGDTITAQITCKEFSEQKPWMGTFTTRCYNQDEQIVIDGEATVYFPWKRKEKE